MTSALEKGPGAARGRLALVLLASLACAALAEGCSCRGPDLSDGGPTDAGPLFRGLDATEYQPRDGGSRPSEPCAGPVRRVRFPLEIEEGLGGVETLIQGSGAHVWLYLSRGSRDRPPLRLFDVESEREIGVALVVRENEVVLGVFLVTSGYEVVVRGPEGVRVVGVDMDGRVMDDAPLDFSVSPTRPVSRLDDGRYAAFFPDDSSVTGPARLELASRSGSVQEIGLGFGTSRGHLATLQTSDGTLVGIAHADAAGIVRFEVEPASGTVRLQTLDASALLGSSALWFSGGVVTAAVVHQPLEAAPGSAHVAELFWWTLADTSLTRLVVRPSSTLLAEVMALGGDMPRQTLVLAQSTRAAEYVTVARVRGPADAVGGSEPLGVFPSGIASAAAWQPTEGTLAVALLSQRELDVRYYCEGAP